MFNVNKIKVFILGLDGATWSILKPLSNLGVLHNIKRLMDNGCVGVLKSTIPPITSPAWPCLATGMNPGKIGVFSTLMRTKKDEFRLRPINSSVYKGMSFWDILSRHGYRVALIKIPFLYPVYAINGCMISGFGSFGKLGVYPKKLYENVMGGPSKLLEMRFFDKLTRLNVNSPAEASRFIESAIKLIQEEIRVVLELIQELSWDLLFYVLSATDWIQHAFMDKILELITKLEAKEFSSISKVGFQILAFYKLVDQTVGQLANFVVKNKEYVSL